MPTLPEHFNGPNWTCILLVEDKAPPYLNAVTGRLSIEFNSPQSLPSGCRESQLHKFVVLLKSAFNGISNLNYCNCPTTAVVVFKKCEICYSFAWHVLLSKHLQPNGVLDLLLAKILLGCPHTDVLGRSRIYLESMDNFLPPCQYEFQLPCRSDQEENPDSKIW